MFGGPSYLWDGATPLRFPDPDPQRELLVSQRNDILAAIESAGFDPREFAWGQIPDDWTGHDDDYVPAITHQPTGFFCAISNRPFFAGARAGMQGQFQVRVSPGFHLRTEEVTGIPSFNGVLAQVREWLTRVHRENVPDRWQELEASRTLVGLVIEQEPDNAPFGADDLARIAASLTDLRQIAAVQLALDAVQLNRFDAVAGYLRLASERGMGRKDWFLLSVALLMWAVPVDKAGPFARAVIHGLQWVVHVLPPLLP